MCIYIIKFDGFIYCSLITPFPFIYQGLNFSLARRGRFRCTCAEATFLSARHIPQGRYPSTSASAPVYSAHSILKNPHFPRISRWKNATRIMALRRHSYHRGTFLKVMTRRPQLPHMGTARKAALFAPNWFSLRLSKILAGNYL